MGQTESPDGGPSVKLLLRFAVAAHEAGGYPASELELRVAELAQALGLPPAEVIATPNVLHLTLGLIPDQQVFVQKVRPGPVDLHVIHRLDEIVAALADGLLDQSAALEEIEALGRNPVRHSLWLAVGAHGLVSAALTPILGGGWRELLGAGIVGLAVGLAVRLLFHSHRSAPLVAPFGAFLSSFLSCAIADIGFDISVQDVTFAALIVFLPGMSLATGVRELATGHLQAGIANSAHALIQLVGLVFGVAAGRSMAESWFVMTPANAPDSFPTLVSIVAAAFVGLAFSITLRAPARDAVWTTTAAVLAIVSNLVSTRFLGGIAGPFVAALVVGLAGNAVAIRFRRSPLAFIVPGLMMLIPGAIGYSSVSSLIEGRTVTGIDRAFDSLVTMLSIAYGLVIATLLLPEETAIIRGRRNSSRHGIG